METRFFTEKDRLFLEQTVTELDKKLSRVRNTILGGNISFLPLITDAGGELSNEKIEALAEDMVKALREYETPYGELEPGGTPQNYHTEGNRTVPDESAPKLDAEKEELYKCFAYCAVCAAAVMRDLGGTFGDILDLAANRIYAVDSEYYFSTDDSLELFGNLAACELGTDVLSEYYKKHSHPLSRSTGSAGSAINGKATLPTPEKFISEFKKYVKLSNAVSGGRDHITERSNMVMTYLYKKGLTVLALEDDYSALENILEKFRSAVEAECSDRIAVTSV